MIEIDKNIIIETEHLGSNNAIVCTRDGVVLIDAPHRPSDAIKWRRLAESNGPIRYLINTDHHIDHTMCNNFLPGEIVSHEGTRDKLLNSPPSRQYIDELLDVIDPAGKMYLDEYTQRLPTITYSKSMVLRTRRAGVSAHPFPGPHSEQLPDLPPAAKDRFYWGLGLRGGPARIH